mmetsp:Transcript_41951/g.103484  ORF Transcript_41951/g.103484 Transcript_41951/m.103484 type:complete len:191 (+) Transcript_41951:203-775(+)
MARRAGIGRQFKKGAKDPRVLASVVQRTAERQAAGPPRGPPTVDPSERKRTRKSTKKAAAVDGRRRMRVSETDERTAIKVVFDMLGRPPEAEWDGRGGTATRIMQGLNLNGSPRKVKRTLAAIQEGGTDWDPSAGSARGGRKKNSGSSTARSARTSSRRASGWARRCTTSTTCSARRASRRCARRPSATT